MHHLSLTYHTILPLGLLFFRNSILSLVILKTQNANPIIAKLKINLNETCFFSLKQFLGHFIWCIDCIFFEIS